MRSPLGAPSLVEVFLDEIEARDAQLALADAELREILDAFADLRALLEREVVRRADLFEGLPDGCILTDGSGVIEDANEGAERMFALPTGRFVGKLLISFVARRDTRAFRDRLREIQATRTPPPFELSLRPRGGAPFAAVLNGRRLASHSGRLIGIRWTLRPARTTTEIPAMGELRSRMLRAVRSLRVSLTEAQAQARVLGDGVAAAEKQAETLRAIVQTIAHQNEPLDELEEMARWDERAHGTMS